jgi:hypothetical protein
MAQDYYGPGDNSDNGNREFHFNPGNVMNRMPNPMQNFFGSSNRRYNGYEDRYVPPPAYPPAYAYPGYQPQAGYGYGYPYPQAAPQVSPPPAPAPETGRARVEQPPAAAQYRAPENVEGYRFRPMQEVTTPPAREEMPVGSQTYPPQQNQAPTEYPSYQPLQEPLAPITTPEPQVAPAPVAKSAPETITHEGKSLKFRPLDQPGYSPDLDK